MIGSSIPAPRKDERARQDAARAIGCACCLLNLRFGLRMVDGMRIEIHHQLRGGHRIGQRETVAGCHWHHQGKQLPADCGTVSTATMVYGPSLGHDPNGFRDAYGSDAELLAFQDRVIAAVAAGETDPAMLAWA